MICFNKLVANGANYCPVSAQLVRGFQLLAAWVHLSRGEYRRTSNLTLLLSRQERGQMRRNLVVEIESQDQRSQFHACQDTYCPRSLTAHAYQSTMLSLAFEVLIYHYLPTVQTVSVSVSVPVRHCWTSVN
jgi:hypothetical protein